MTTRLCALLTCFNRRDKTLACLAALARCTLPDNVALSVVLVDDASRDGTAAAVAARFPAVTVLQGDGSRYWAGGMRMAYAAAMAQAHDDYLWLNDDTLLDAGALLTLYGCRATLPGADGAMAIVVGATRDPAAGNLTYGGLVPRDAHSRNFLVNLPVGQVAQRCKTMNGNCVLIPQAAAARLGNLDARFVHGIGDWDYGLRATAAGIGVWQAPGFVGTCERNPPTVLPPAVARSVRARLRHVCGPKQVPPRAWLTYVHRNYGAAWPIEFAKPYASAVRRALAAKWHHWLARRPTPNEAQP